MTQRSLFRLSSVDGFDQARPTAFEADAASDIGQGKKKNALTDWLANELKRRVTNKPKRVFWDRGGRIPSVCVPDGFQKKRLRQRRL